MFANFFGLVSFIIVLLLLAFVFFGVRSNPKNLFYKPIYIFVLFFAIVHVMLPALQYQNNFYRYQEGYQEGSSLIVLLFCISCLFFLVLSNKVADKIFHINRRIMSENWGKSVNVSLFDTFFVSLVFGVAFYFIYKNINQILFLGIAEYLKDRIAFSFSAGYLTLIAHWSYIISVLCFCAINMNSVTKTKYYLIVVLFLSSVTLSTVYYSINSNRNSLFVLGASCLLIWFVHSKKTLAQKSFRIFIATLLFAFAFSTIGQLRHQFKHSIVEVTDSKTLSFEVVETLNSAFGNNENLLWLLENQFELQMGRNYLAAFTNIIPRSFWPNKPLGAGPAFKNMVYPGSYVLGGDKNSSLTTGLLTEGVMNFGWLGAFVICILSGLVFSLISSVSLQLNRSGHPFVFGGFVIIIFAFGVQIIYSEFMGWFSRLMFSFAPVGIWYLLHRIRNPLHMLAASSKR